MSGGFQGESSDTITPRLQRAELYVAQGRNEEALAEIDRGLADQPGEPRLLQMRGWLLLQLGRYREAAELLRGLLGARPDMHHARAVLAEALRLQKDIAGAEEAILACLDEEPGVAEYHLNYAAVLADSSGRGRAGRRARKLALERIGTALELGHDDPDALRWAAQLVWQLGDPRRAKELAETGLAIAPEHPRLHVLHADLTAALTEPTSRYDTVSRPAALAREMSRVLAADPQHRGARRALFTELWSQRMLLIDAPLSLLAVLAVTAGASFGAAGTPATLLTGAGIALMIAVFRLVGYAIVAARADRGFRRQLGGASGLDLLRRVLSGVAWCAAVAGMIALPLVRDAVVVRWLIVGLGAAALAGLAASLIWQAGFPGRARTVGGYDEDGDSLHRLREHRSTLTTRIALRVLASLLFLFLGLFALAGRQDAIPVIWVCIGALLMPPVIGLLIVRRTETATRRGLRAGVDAPQGYRPPRAPGFIWASLTGAGAIAALVLGAAALPVLPNEHDADGVYVLEYPEPSGERDRCGGRPASRLACQLDRIRERIESTRLPPTPSVPNIPEVPDIPDFSELGDLGGHDIPGNRTGTDADTGTDTGE